MSATSAPRRSATCIDAWGPITQGRVTGAWRHTTTGWPTIEDAPTTSSTAAAHAILAKGEYLLTEVYIADRVTDNEESASFKEVLRSRRDFKRGDLSGKAARSERNMQWISSLTLPIAKVNLASLAFNLGDYELALTSSEATRRYQRPIKASAREHRRSIRQTHQFVHRRRHTRTRVEMLESLVVAQHRSRTDPLRWG